MRRVRAFLGIGVVVGLPLIVIRALHGMADHRWFQIDWADFGGWMASTDLVDAITALSRPLALGVAYWSLIGTLLYLFAVLTGSERLINAVAPFTLPVVRRLADRVVAGSIAVGVIATPLLGTTGSLSAEPGVAAPAPVAADYVPAALTVTAAPLPPPEPVSVTQRPVAAPVSEPPQQPEQVPMVTQPTVGQVEVTARAGDHLWGLAERRVSEVLGRAPSDPEIAPYWRAVVEQNRATLRSGDPDLIHPGEVVVLPDPTGLIPGGS